MASSVRPVLAAVIAASLFSSAAAKSVRVTVGPANVDRASQLITFPLTAGEPRADGVRDKNGAILPLQIATDGTAAFIVPVQKAGETLTFTISDGDSATAPKGVVVTAAKDALKVTLGGKPVFEYQMNKDALPRPDIKPAFKRAGYLHPIHTQSGTIVSDDYPVQHVHHHGIWSPWTKTTFQGRKPDFWNMGDKTGTVEFEEVTWTWSGAVHGGFVARHRFVDLSAPNPVTALNEVWQVTAYNVSDARVFDLVLTQVCATNDPLGLPLYHYGGLGFRGRGEWYGKDKANFLTSEGETDRVKANAQKMRWVHLSGAVEGGTAGLAVLGHPDNFRAPQPVRVHPSEPYVSFTPSQGGDWKIEPGKPYVARYRFVAADGPPERARLDARWNGFALTPTVKVENAP